MRTEREILKDFKNLGYAIDNDKNYCNIEHEYDKKKILINKNLKMVACCKPSSKSYGTIINGTQMRTSWFNVDEPRALLINEFKLLYELFELWGWLNNEKETKKKSNYNKVLDLLEYAGADGDFLFEFENEIREIVNKLNAYDLIRAAKKEEDKNEKSTNFRNN